ncbi:MULTISPECIES: endonuclease/exonuclease/phosphatase family protein [Xanthomonas]|uniref:endonuclease/exonuclease/phosphatase family protein n=1 Tax=Xanthomonas TaxID=338 RepID=UPI001ADB8528|nr:MULTISPECIES: endonuclease/exonuclease/phosphatase family protein [unclassified Xanthomonas]MBO9874139.1 endonuclease/exonuclease/phosphatase family protein [Xanthomonas sp. D-93]WNH46516.1 endonuclease/exonuclease/phosphatase family protein [Xanthomonas sp. A6251]
MNLRVFRWHRTGWLLLAVAALAHAQAMPDAMPTIAAPADSPLTVVTLTLAGDPHAPQDGDDWSARRERIVVALQRLHPDAIALQEVVQTPEIPNQAQWLAARLGYHCHFISPDPPSRSQRRGNALLTRLPVLEEAETLLHPLEDYSVAGLVRVDLHGQPVNLYFTRLHAARDGGASRREQAEDLMAWIDATAEGVPSLLAGGFFATARAPELAPLAARFEDGSVRGESARNRIDVRAPGTAAAADHVFFERGHFRPLHGARLFAPAPDLPAAGARGLLMALQPLDPMPTSLQPAP